MGSLVVQMVLAGGGEQFNDPTATLLLQIDCIERDSLELQCVGYAVIPLFVDPREETQPRRKNLLDYILNQARPTAPTSFFLIMLNGLTFVVSPSAAHQAVLCIALQANKAADDASPISANLSFCAYCFPPSCIRTLLGSQQ